MLALLGTPNAVTSEYVTVSNGEFMLRNEPYRYIGTNLWYAPVLASKGPGGDRNRLLSELDSLKSMGVENLRILAGGDGDRSRPYHIEPNLQTAPGVYNPDLLEGLDFLLAEMEKRDMRGVFYLTNSWEWSGGYGSYLEWTGHGVAPLPVTDGYEAYVDYVSKFMQSESAKQLFYNHVINIVSRTNSITGRPYAESPAIMSWQICNEPRCFSKGNKQLFYDWLISTAELIKSVDPNHLVSVGSEGKYGCEVDIELWAKIHESDKIDYATIHIWPYIWRWVEADSLDTKLGVACDYTLEYLLEHRNKTDKPLVLEEFGYPRDNLQYAVGTPVTARDGYYRFVIGLLTERELIQGLNFWGWGGLVQPVQSEWRAGEAYWKMGDPYTGDPAQEPQGFFSVFASDSTTVAVLKEGISKLR